MSYKVCKKCPYKLKCALVGPEKLVIKHYTGGCPVNTLIKACETEEDPDYFTEEFVRRVK